MGNKEQDLPRESEEAKIRRIENKNAKTILINIDIMVLLQSMNLIIYLKAIFLLASEKVLERDTSHATFIKCGEYNISYAKSGSGKKIIVLLHGWGQSKKTWQNIIPELEKQFTIYTVDLPGFGNSSRPPKLISVEDYADIIYLFSKNLQIRTFTMLGHSFGGKISAILAYKYPKHVDKLIFYSSSIGLAQNEPVSPISKLVKFILKITSIHTLGVSLSFLLFDNTHNNINFTRNILRVKQPVLLLYGKYDILAPVFQGYFIKKKLPNSSLVIFNKSTHLAHKEEANKFIDTLIRFIQNDQ